MKGRGTGEKKEIDKRTNNASSTSPTKSTMKATNQSYESGGHGSRGGERKKSSRGTVFHLDRFEGESFCLGVALTFLICMIAICWYQNTCNR